MSRPVRITSQAHRDIAVAALWYEKRQRGLGERFFADVDASIEAIGKRPGSFPDVYRGLQRAQLRDFRYGVFFSVTGTEIVVVGVIDLRRDPGTWQRRR